MLETENVAMKTMRFHTPFHALVSRVLGSIFDVCNAMKFPRISAEGVEWDLEIIQICKVDGKFSH